MTIDEAVTVLNERKYKGAGDWFRWRPSGIVISGTASPVIPESEAIAIAERLLRNADDGPSLADEADAVLAQLDELAESWGDEGVFRRCRDRLRAALARERGAV